MKILKILEWNINQRSTGRQMPDYVCTEILRKEPDIIVLVEFKGADNLSVLQAALPNYYIEYYDGIVADDKLGNGILIALNKKKFNQPTTLIFPKKYQKNMPDWMSVCTTLAGTNQLLEIIGIKVHVSSIHSERKELEFRKAQINWLLNNNSLKDCTNRIIIGDFNYGPHLTEYLYNGKKRINWQDIIKLMWDHDYVKEAGGLTSPYAPTGTSWKSERLDWLITTKGISVKTFSDYNNLDWSFGRYNTQKYKNGYLVPEGYFIRTDSTYPDHAIFTAEISFEK